MMSSDGNTLILIADDQPDNLKVILKILTNAEPDARFLQATSGDMAVRVAKMRLPDLIIMDWEMPDLSGYEALVKIKDDSETKDIPVIMATGRASSRDLKMALEAGASDYIRKPVEKIELIARVNTCLSINSLLKQLKEKNDILEDLNREKDGVLNIVAHDLRTPLNNIYGLLNLIEIDNPLNEDQRDYIDSIKNVIKDGNSLIQDLLDVNSAKNGDVGLTITEVLLDDFISAWASNFQSQLSEKKQSLHVSGTLADFKIKTDKSILTRILDNLLTNAMKFSERGKNIYLHINKLENRLVFSLRDEGPGISREDRLKMFKPFTRLSAVPTAGETTNGLGLSIIKALVEKLEGEVTVESEVGVGSTFLVEIPS